MQIQEIHNKVLKNLVNFLYVWRLFRTQHDAIIYILVVIRLNIEDLYFWLFLAESMDQYSSPIFYL